MRSHMRFSYIPCTLALLVACTPGGGSSDTTDASTSTTSEPTTAEPTSSTSSTSSTGVTTTVTTTEATTTVTTEVSTTVTATTDATTVITTTDTTTSDTVGTSDTTDTTDTTTGAPAEPCVDDADCKLHDDCCTCEGVPVGTDIADCPGECVQSTCASLGIEAAVCRLGVCETERLSCDQSAIICDEAPPPCDPGKLPQTTPGCYTGQCVPASLCDVVLTCKDCPADTMCVQKVSFGIDSVTCEPIPPGCDGKVDCACVGDLVCTGMYGLCSSQGAVVSCECPNC